MTHVAPQRPPEAPVPEELVTIPDLHRLVALLGCPYDIDAHYDRQGFWVVTFTIGGRRYGLSTVRGARRSWRQLEPVLAFLYEQCRDYRSVRLHTPSWTFCGTACPGNLCEILP